MDSQTAGHAYIPDTLRCEDGPAEALEGRVVVGPAEDASGVIL